ncbi:hypothetical protein BH10ACT1_BH10ACT1_15320 [soil metagenome]
MTMLRLDLTDTGQSADQELVALREENRSLRAYLKRVLELLERNVEERSVVDHPAPGAFDGALAADRLADLEDGVQRIEHDLQTLLWLVRGDDRPAMTSVD